jgi:hypothetical protein
MGNCASFYGGASVYINIKAGNSGSKEDRKLTKEERNLIFQKAKAKALKRFPNHKFKWVNKFATATTVNNSVVKIQIFLTYNAAVLDKQSDDKRYILNGVTTVGESFSTIYASAVFSKSEGFMTITGRKPVSLNSLEAAQFVLYHEIKHGMGAMDEENANSFGLACIYKYVGVSCRK